MSGEQSDPIVEAGKAFTRALDGEGHSFHYSLLRAVDNLSRAPNKNYSLNFEVSEFPVSNHGKDSRVDFILRTRHDYSGDRSVLLVCECKRANPALKDWMFVRAPYVRRGPTSPMVIGELLQRVDDRRAMNVTTVSYSPVRAPFHVGLPVKRVNPEKGDDKGNGRDIIEKAATQVITFLNGFVDFVHRDPELLKTGPVVIVPVIFTTATLYGSDTDIGTASLTDGCLVETATVEQVPWLWFQYPVSTGLRHQAPRTRLGNRTALGDILEQEHTRSIAIVNPAGIGEFIQAVANASHLFETMR